MALLASRKIIAEVGSEIARSLGVNPSDVLGFTLDVTLNDLPVLTVRLLTDEGVSEEVREVFRKYTLVPREEPDLSTL